MGIDSNMKSIFLFVFFASGLSCLSQDIVDTANNWNTQVRFEYPYGNIVTEAIRFSADTVIDQINYKKVLRSLEENQAEWNSYGFIRENQNRVFYKLTAPDPERMICDLNLNLYDFLVVYGLYTFGGSNPVLDSMTYYVTLVDSLQIGDSYRRQLHLSVSEGCQFVEVEQWVEGMGSRSGILHNFDGKVGDDGDLLLCFKTGDTLMYMDPGSVTCYVSTGTGNVLQNAPEISVYPNPATDRINVDLKNINSSLPLEVYLFNGFGTEVLDELKNNFYQKSIVSLAGISPGIYFYELRQNSTVIGRGKLIKY